MYRFRPISPGAVSVIAALLVGCSTVSSPPSSDPNASAPPASASAAASVPATPELSASAEPSASVTGGLPLGSHVVTKDIGNDVTITVTIPAPGWDGEANGGYLCWIPVADCAGPPDGAGLIAFNDSEYYVHGDPCNWSTTTPSDAATTADDLVAALAQQGSRQASTPEDITLDGHTGKKIILRVADDLDLAFSAGDFTDCDDGKLALFGVAGENPARWSQGPGQIEEVWAVDVDGAIAVLIGTYYADTPQSAVDEMREMLGSMRLGD